MAFTPKYILRPAGRPTGTFIWAPCLRLALTLKKQAERITGRKWKITNKDTTHDNSV